MQHVAPASTRPICHVVQQVASVCVTGTRSPALSLPWEVLDAYAFSPAAILGQVVEKLQDSPCKRIILIAPGWPNIPWFLGPSGNVQSDPSEPVLLAQPVNSALQSDPSQKSDNLNLHAWLLEPHQSRSRASLKQWQQELRLLKEDQPDQSMRQSGPLLQVVCH